MLLQAAISDATGTVRRDARVPQVIRAQAPLLARFSAAPAGADLRELARGLLAA
ncbi:hypothetical protein [Sabulicella rubraurantiaca]|uniref:hypothetical protein n=1 Tax=Sabulicella rubraurantiaca TaxID=2811429 RepID=UPI001A95B77B|nr:hypothetical protein [Sabulicella rubraurantiaca]